MDVYVPEGETSPMPGILLLHGGSWSSGSKKDIQDLSFLSRKKLVVAFANYRLNEKDEPSDEQMEDVHSMLRFLNVSASKFNLNPSKLVIGGFSAGGHLAALGGLTAGNGSFADIPGVAGIVMWSAPPGSYGDPKFNLAQYVQPASPPFLILHGRRDTTVPIFFLEEFSGILKARGVKVRLSSSFGMHVPTEYEKQSQGKELVSFVKNPGGGGWWKLIAFLIAIVLVVLAKIFWTKQA